VIQLLFINFSKKINSKDERSQKRPRGQLELSNIFVFQIVLILGQFHGTAFLLASKNNGLCLKNGRKKH
jgi:hypothetical protein